MHVRRRLVRGLFERRRIERRRIERRRFLGRRLEWLGLFRIRLNNPG
jgi:hypothetical protein